MGESEKPKSHQWLDLVTRQREPGDDDDVPAPPRFDVNGELLPFTIAKVVDEMKEQK